METNEHRDAGNKIRIETLGNPYLQGSKNLSPKRTNDLHLRMMQEIDGIPVPLAIELSAGDVVALAGDYYTKAGWWEQLKIPPKSGDGTEESYQLLHSQVAQSETDAFGEAYADLASPSVTKKAISRIYSIDESRFIPSLLQQLIYAITVKDYGAKLSSNEDHFAPWSLRGYIVGHQSSLNMAEMAFYCHRIANQDINLDDAQIPQEIHKRLSEILKKIKSNPGKYIEAGLSDPEILTELGHRFHALAVAHDLFAMHFYSDHFAGGHLSRMGTMRKLLPEQFGVWGSILVNNMHNEDNKDSVAVTNVFQPPNVDAGTFQMLKEDCSAYGDGTYFQHGNDKNVNMLINGMDNSLGDIARLMVTGEKRQSLDYGGLTFLPEIDYSQHQNQPLFIQGTDNKIYFRSDVKHIKTLSPSQYETTAKAPLAHGYEELTPGKAFLLVIKLRLLAPFYSPKVEPLRAEEQESILRDEQEFASKIKLQKVQMKQSTVSSGATLKREDGSLGQWRLNRPQASILPLSFLNGSAKQPLVKAERSLEPQETLLKSSTN